MPGLHGFTNVSGIAHVDHGIVDYEFLDHPADIGFRAYGQSLEDLLANCAHALIAIVLDASAAKRVDEYSLQAEGDDLESLLVNWLNEILFYVDTRRLVFASFEIELLSPFGLKCTASGEPHDPEKHPPRVLVKAVTYHQLKISSTAQGWVAEVYVDV